VRLEGVEPTNNAAERAVRPTVIWRKTSFGTQSRKGSDFVERILTTVARFDSRAATYLSMSPTLAALLSSADLLRRSCRREFTNSTSPPERHDRQDRASSLFRSPDFEFEPLRGESPMDVVHYSGELLVINCSAIVRRLPSRCLWQV